MPELVPMEDEKNILPFANRNGENFSWVRWDKIWKKEKVTSEKNPVSPLLALAATQLPLRVTFLLRNYL